MSRQTSSNASTAHKKQKYQDIHCPYCGKVITPAYKEDVGRELVEVQSVPYTRDIGRFDPKTEAEWFDPSKWSQIGQDYLKAFNYDKYVGILRASRPGILVWYRVQACPHCHKLFDVYANYTVDEAGNTIFLKDLWPHIFTPDEQGAGGFEAYHAVSITLWGYHKLSNALHSGAWGAAAFALVLFALGSFPWLLPGHPPLEQHGLVNFWASILSHGIVAVFIAVMLVLLDRFLLNFSDINQLEKLLDLKIPGQAVHWRNFSLCRFVGVQRAGHFPVPTQSEILAGGLSVTSLLLIWAGAHLSGIEILELLGALVIFSAGLFVFSRLRHSKKELLSWVWLALLILLLAGLLAGMAIYNRWTLFQGWKSLQTICELAFWLIAAFFIGLGAFFGESSAEYVLKSIRRIPMNLTPYNDFEQEHTLRTIQNFSTRMMLALFLALLGIVAILLLVPTLAGSQSSESPFLVTKTSLLSALLQPASSTPVNWLLLWLQWALALLFVGLGMGGAQIGFIVVTAVYLALQSLLSIDSPITYEFSKLPFMVNPQLLVLSLFLTVLLAYHLSNTDRIVSGLVDDARKEHLKKIDGQINETLKKIDEARTKGDAGGAELNETLERLSSLLEIRKFIEGSGKKQRSRMAELSSLVLWSLVLPYLWSYLLDPLIKGKP